MSIAGAAIEPLSVQELKLVRRAFLVQAFIVALILLGTIPVFFGLLTSNSVEEFIFSGAIALLCCAGLSAFVYLNIGTWQDFRTRTKLVFCGRVTAINTRVIRAGLIYSISVGNYVVSDSMCPPVPTFDKLKVGDMVEVSHLTNSGRTLRLILKPNIAFNPDAPQAARRLI